MALHNCPRYTKDLDIYINNDLDSACKLEKALYQFGYPNNLSEEYLKPNKMIILGVEPNRIDILNSPKGISFDECYETKLTTYLNSTPIYYINKENLIKNKLAVGRAQDLVDVEKLNN